jgi:hypothetical protein
LGVLVRLTLKKRRLLCMHRHVETKLHSFLVLGEHPMARKTKRLTLSTTGQAELINATNFVACVFKTKRRIAVGEILCYE